MKLSDLHGKNIALLGLGIENLALLRFFVRHKIKAELTVIDRRPRRALPFVAARARIMTRWRVGAGSGIDFGRFDILFRSPGWPTFCPQIRAALKAKKNQKSKIKIQNLLYSPIRLFFDLCPTKNIIGVTGTKGKGTTSLLIFHIMKTAGRRVWLGGNIGVAPFSFIEKIRPDDWVILELSSFQLEDMETSPRLAVFTNFYPEHLAPADPNNPNFHPSVRAYWAAKINVFRWQKRGDRAVLNENLKVRTEKIKNAGRKFYFGKSGLPSRLPGEHNRENVAAAAAAARLAGVKAEAVRKAVASFRAFAHRLEFVAASGGISYYNDSSATTPESTITALKSFCAPVILIAGGAEKRSDFGPLARGITKRAKGLVLLPGAATPRLERAARTAGFPRPAIYKAAGMKSAVRTARLLAQAGDIVLLSPACASFGLFKNYKERGEKFRQAVNAGIKIKKPPLSR